MFKITLIGCLQIVGNVKKIIGNEIDNTIEYFKKKNIPI